MSRAKLCLMVVLGVGALLAIIQASINDTEDDPKGVNLVQLAVKSDAKQQGIKLAGNADMKVDEVKQVLTESADRAASANAEVIERQDERFRIKPQRGGTGAGTEREPFAEWNRPYHEGRQAHRARYESEDAAIPATQANRKTRIHTFYTIDCTYHSLWQVMTLEMSWEEVKQGGVISRVSSGCDSAPQEKRIAIGKSILSDENKPNFGAFYAPTFSKLPNGDYYAPYNRPNGIWFWLNHTDLTEDVYIALDPDMLYLNRLVVADIRPGHFVSMYYGYMTHHPYHKYDCPLCPDHAYYDGKDTQSAHRRLKELNPKRPPHHKHNFDVGPPWLFTLDDLITIMPTWVGLVPMLREKDKSLWIVEMVAYSVACAFHDIPHEVIHYGMVDNVGQAKVWDGNEISSKELEHPIGLLHFCFTWETGENAPPPGDAAGGDRQHHRMINREKENKRPVTNYYHFSKYRVPSDWPGGKGSYPHNILDCRTPLMQEFHTPRDLPENPSRDWLRNVHFMELYLPKLNQALAKWKTEVTKCKPEELNLEKRLRTSHPRYWISDYIINYTYPDQKTISYYPSPGKKETP